MATLEKKNLNRPDETKELEKAKRESVTVAGVTILRMTAEPGWRWSKNLRPVGGTQSCQVHHIICVVSGRLKVRMDDGKEEEFGPGDIGSVPPGHDGWTIGDKRAVWLEIPH
jgi:mannose-6-phosphate isomerase-like protein (cupin superfamily)